MPLFKFLIADKRGVAAGWGLKKDREIAEHLLTVSYKYK
jgi:hypothetical protein